MMSIFKILNVDLPQDYLPLLLAPSTCQCFPDGPRNTEAKGRWHPATAWPPETQHVTRELTNKQHTYYALGDQDL